MSLETVTIIDIAPQRVYCFPEKMTYGEIEKNVATLHKIAEDEANRTIYCLFEQGDTEENKKFELCFPVERLNLTKYKESDFRVLPRIKGAAAQYAGDFSDLSACVQQLRSYGESQGYTSGLPVRLLFHIKKKAIFTKKAPEVVIEIQVPLESP